MEAPGPGLTLSTSWVAFLLFRTECGSKMEYPVENWRGADTHCSPEGEPCSSCRNWYFTLMVEPGWAPTSGLLHG